MYEDWDREQLERWEEGDSYLDEVLLREIERARQLMEWANEHHANLVRHARAKAIKRNGAYSPELFQNGYEAALKQPKQRKKSVEKAMELA